VGDNARVRDATGWSPGHSLRELIEDLVNYWAARPAVQA
jgi:nucleoside-diphosphate-sugar epimerase